MFWLLLVQLDIVITKLQISIKINGLKRLLPQQCVKLVNSSSAQVKVVVA